MESKAKKTENMASYRREYMRDYMRKHNKPTKKINCIITFSDSYTDDEINTIKETLSKIGEKLHVSLKYYNAGRKKKTDSPEKPIKEKKPEKEKENVDDLSDILSKLSTVI
jgi:hypothetical protein